MAQRISGCRHWADTVVGLVDQLVLISKFLEWDWSQMALVSLAGMGCERMFSGLKIAVRAGA